MMSIAEVWRESVLGKATPSPIIRCQSRVHWFQQPIRPRILPEQQPRTTR